MKIICNSAGNCVQSSGIVWPKSEIMHYFSVSFRSFFLFSFILSVSFLMMSWTASESRARRRVYLQHITEKDPITEERKRNFSNELWARRRIPDKWFIKKTDAGT